MLNSAVRESLGHLERVAVRSSSIKARTASKTHAGRFAGVEEPLLTDLLNDPLTQRVMASDGVKQQHLMLVIAEVQARLNGA